MQITRFKTQYLPTTMVIIVALFAWVLSASGVATAGYADSAHGDSSVGVKRAGVECPTGTPCPTGDCTHCHDTFDESICGVNERMLFYSVQTVCDMICFECHGDTLASEQQVTNYPYSVLFGGFPTLYFPSILHQFCATPATHANGGSRHSLAQIWSIIKNNTLDWGFSANPNPCGACHNPHLSQKIGNTPYSPPPYDSSKSPLTRPSERYSNPANLWGDDATERMKHYAENIAGGYYQAPYYGNGPWDPEDGPFEPAGDGTSDGSNLPDYVTFCMDCHQYAQYDPESGEDVKAIKWGPPWCTAAEADMHGAAPANTRDGFSIGCMATEGPLRPPYDTYEPGESDYILSCLDCHEPHGTYQRPYLIRVQINGEFVADSSFVEICQTCHAMNHPYGSCNVCHGHSVGPMAGFHGSRFECAADEGCSHGNPELCPPSF